MDLDSYYSAAAALVERDAELQRARYKTKDGRYVISSSDLRLLSMRGHISPDEYVSGLDLEKITLKRQHALCRRADTPSVNSLTDRTAKEVTLP